MLIDLAVPLFMTAFALAVLIGDTRSAKRMGRTSRNWLIVAAVLGIVAVVLQLVRPR